MKTEHKLYKLKEDFDFGLIPVKNGKRIIISTLYEDEVPIRTVVSNSKGGFICDITLAELKDLVDNSLIFIRDNPFI